MASSSNSPGQITKEKKKRKFFETTTPHDPLLSSRSTLWRWKKKSQHYNGEVFFGPAEQGSSDKPTTSSLSVDQKDINKNTSIAATIQSSRVVPMEAGTMADFDFMAEGVDEGNDINQDEEEEFNCQQSTPDNDQEDEDESSSGTSSSQDEEDSDFHHEQNEDEDGHHLEEDGVNVENDQILFKESGITVTEALAITAAFSLRHSLSKEGVNDLLGMIKTFSGQTNWNSSNYYIDKLFNIPEKVICYNFFCNVCLCPLDNQFSKNEVVHQLITCRSCQNQFTLNLSSSNSFISLNLQYQLKSFMENPTLQEEVDLIDINKECCHGTDIEDICDGSLYKKIRSHVNFDYSFNFNTDGAPVYHSSKSSMWPIQIIINELPPKIRFRKPILAGIFFGPKEPAMNTFMSAFVEECEKVLTEGVEWYFKNTLIHSKFSALCCCVDSVARPLLLNSTQFNGYNGCNYCYHPGRSERKRGQRKQIKYPVDVEAFSTRTSEEICSDSRNALESGKKCNGIKGPSVLMNIPHFDLVFGVPPDYMHAVLLGVTKSTFDTWTTYNGHGPDSNNNAYYIGSPRKMLLINNRLIRITPPSEIHRLPRPLAQRSKWKASEWRSWLLFYSVPCLSGILDAQYLENWALLVTSIYLLLKTKITQDDLDKAQSLLTRFVHDYQILYGAGSMTFNVHLLTHLVQHVKMSGPLWANSAFPFESGIFNLKNQVHGSKDAHKQIVTRTMKIDKLPYILEKTSEDCKTYCNNIFTNSKLKKGATRQGEIVFLGSGISHESNNVSSYYRCIIGGTLFSSSVYKNAAKTNNSFLQLRDRKIVQIKNITHNDYDGACKFLVCEQELQPVVVGNVTIPNIFKIIGFRPSEFISVDDIDRKCVFMSISNTNNFVGLMPNRIEVQ